jgi:fatty acid desaturase
MSHMTENQRMQMGRPDLSVPTTGVGVRSKRPLVIYTIVATAILIALGYATVQALDGWAMLVVLAGIVVTAIGGGIAVMHGRRAPGMS